MSKRRIQITDLQKQEIEENESDENQEKMEKIFLEKPDWKKI